MENLNKNKEIERLICSYGNDVLRVSYLYLKDIQRAEDAFQEVFIKVYKNYHKFNGKSSEKTWILSITINLCKDMLRSSWLRRVFVSDTDITEEKNEMDTDQAAIKKIENKILFNEVMSLPAALKDVIILYYYQQFDTKEISKILGVAEGTVRSRLHRARERLKGKLKGRVDFE